MLEGPGVGVVITAGPITKLFAGGGRRRVEDMCYERRRAEACVDESAHHALANSVLVCLLLQDLLQSCSRGGEEESGGHVL